MSPPLLGYLPFGVLGSTTLSSDATSMATKVPTSSGGRRGLRRCRNAQGAGSMGAGLAQTLAWMDAAARFPASPSTLSHALVATGV